MEDRFTTRPLNAWMRQLGYSWKEGQERLYKAELAWIEAMNLLAELEMEGAVKRG